MSRVTTPPAAAKEPLSPRERGWGEGSARHGRSGHRRTLIRRCAPPSPGGRRKFPRAFAGALLALLLGACSVTRFESPPGEVLDSCDTRWRGLWITREDGGELGDAAIHVDEACRLMMLDQAERGGPVKSVHVPSNFARVGRDD